MSHQPCRMDQVEFPTADPALVALAAELGVIRSHALRIQGLELSLEGATPDLAIMVWERLRAMLLASWRDAQSEGLGLQRRVGVRDRSFGRMSDLPPPSQLDGDREALTMLGKLRGLLEVFLCLTVARIRCGAPSAVPAFARGALERYASQLDGAIRGRGAELVSQWRTERGLDFELFLVCVRPGPEGLLVQAAIGRAI